MRLSAFATLLFTLPLAAAAASFEVRVSHDYAGARPGETIVLPFAEVRARLPDVLLDHVVVRNVATGEIVPAQVTNFNPDDRAARYDDLLWQHDFAAGETEARFVVETTTTPVLPWPARVSARYVPERLDDFAFENDRLAHRVYGPGLDTPAAKHSRMISSGIDVWTKRVPYPIVDRWYLKGHDAYHLEQGEGLDFYSVGTGRGAGGTGVWRDDNLYVSHNYAAWRVLANGPIRAVFELDYAPCDAGDGVRVSETKRFTIDAGRNFHRVESTFTTTPAGASFTLAVGLGLHPKAAPDPVLVEDRASGWMSVWETYLKDVEGELGTGIVLAPESDAAGFVQDATHQLLLVAAAGGDTVTYHIGAGWSRGGHVADRAAWETYLADFAARLRHPLNLTLEPVIQ